MTATLIKGDCLEKMKSIEDKTIDFILADIPYGTTRCSWDEVIPFEKMWEQLNRLIKPNGVIALFAAEPFATKLRMSNIEHYKYDWYWKKTRATGFQHAKNKPLSIIENICIFSNANIGHANILKEKRMIYNPQGIKEEGLKKVTPNKHGHILGNRDKQTGREYEAFSGFPNNLLEYPSIGVKSMIHPTQKPVELLDFIIKTYSNENDIILDFTAGSFSTGAACMLSKRNFIGIELDENYFETGLHRLLDLNDNLIEKYDLIY